MCSLTTKSYLNVPFCELLQRREEWAVSIVSTFRLVEKSIWLRPLNTHINIRKLQEPSTYSLYTGGYNPFNHPIRFYVMNTDVPRILISHAASYWLGLVKVLCDIKAPRIKRQVASIDKKSDFRVKSSHFRTNTPNMASRSQKKQMTSKTVTSGKVHIPSPRVHSFEDAKIQGGKRANKLRSGRDVDISDKKQHSPEEPSATTGKEPKTSKLGNSVHSWPNKKITDSAKDSPSGNIQQIVLMQKVVLKWNISVKKHHIGNITCHLMIPRHFRSTAKVTSSVYKTPTSSTSPMTKENCQAAGKHQSTMNQGQCHARPWRIWRNYTPTHLTGLACESDSSWAVPQWPPPVRVEHPQERSFVHKMYLKKCLQSISLWVDCGSSQFMCYLLHRHGLMVLSDDGLVQVAWIQTYPYFSVCHVIKMKGMVFRYTWVYSKEDTMAHTCRAMVAS